MLFSVAGGPAIVHTLMDRVLDGINHVCAMAFLDDVLVYSETLESHTAHVQEVLQNASALQALPLTLVRSKCAVSHLSSMVI